MNLNNFINEKSKEQYQEKKKEVFNKEVERQVQEGKTRVEATAEMEMAMYKPEKLQHIQLNSNELAGYRVGITFYFDDMKIVDDIIRKSFDVRTILHGTQLVVGKTEKLLKWCEEEQK